MGSHTPAQNYSDKLNTCHTQLVLKNGYYLVGPLQDGLLFENVVVIESLENDGHLGKERREHFPYQTLYTNQQVLLALAVFHHKLKGKVDMVMTIRRDITNAMFMT